ncbi:conserved hypothetical protein [Vibrio cholerae MO10]|uniref:Uncharacterized protein n=1 Tax=Vibrio cholerae (strain MO10) TaxID=345072 RepID=A0A0X1KZE5_VIBCO|nr:conserved hypothetical protein [Vibrio cholerae MO10]
MAKDICEANEKSGGIFFEKNGGGGAKDTLTLAHLSRHDLLRLGCWLFQVFTNRCACFACYNVAGA